MATYYVDGAVGNDSNLGTSEGSGNAWLTIQKAGTTIIAGDKVFVKASATYGEYVTRVAAGAYNNEIVYEGYTTTPGDGGQVTMDGTSTLAYGFYGATKSYTFFFNFIIQNYTSACFYDSAGDGFKLINCVFDSSSTGVLADNSTLVIDCVASNHTSAGFQIDQGQFINCSAYSNSGHGFSTNSTTSVLFYNCLSYDNGDSAIKNASTGFVLSCTLDANNIAGADAVEYGGSSFSGIVYNCILINAGAGSYGIRGVTNGREHSFWGGNNLVYGNDTDYSTGWPDDGRRDTDVTGDPVFTASGSGDYTLDTGSAAINAGADNSGTGSPGMDIGAHQSEDAGGGGSRVIITG